MSGNKGMFQCRNKGCTSDVDYETPKDAKCKNCGKKYPYDKKNKCYFKVKK